MPRECSRITLLVYVALDLLFLSYVESSQHLKTESYQCELPFHDSNPQSMTSTSPEYRSFRQATIEIPAGLQIGDSGLCDLLDASQPHGSNSVEYEYHVFRESVVGLSLRTDLEKIERAAQDDVHEVVFAIQQKNLELLMTMLDDISNPDSDNYGQHKSREEIEALSSNSESRNQVIDYIRAAGAIVVSESLFSEYISAQAPISIWEKIFNTEFFKFHYTFVKGATVTEIVRAEKYSVPKDLHEHLASVFHTVQMPLAIWGIPVNSHAKNISGFTEANTMSGSVTPMLLNRYYNIDSNRGSNAATQAAFGTIGYYYSPKDITNFQKAFHLPIQTVAISPGGHKDDRICTFIPELCYEANLDLQYLMATCQDSPTRYWYTDKNSFADWLISVANEANPPLVLSISYGAEEKTVSKSEFDAFNFQALKLSLMGVTIVAASGDDGANSVLTRVQSGVCGYAPLFPASSPYVTAVGATQGPESGKTEVLCQSDLDGEITSGGGFSTYYPQPSWQSNEIAAYFAAVTGTIKAPVTGFKATGRGYPDISLVGFSYITSVGEKMIALSGTSASCPVFAGMISLVNAARLAANKSSLGWINPTLYNRKKSFVRDITSGKNNCGPGLRNSCCSHGFYAAPGWDPTTGLGSIDFVSFKKEMMNIEKQTLSPTAKPTTSPTIHPTAPSTRVPTAIPKPKPTTNPTIAATSLKPSQASTTKSTVKTTLKPTTAQLIQVPVSVKLTVKPTSAQISQGPTDVKQSSKPSTPQPTTKVNPFDTTWPLPTSKPTPKSTIKSSL